MTLNASPIAFCKICNNFKPEFYKFEDPNEFFFAELRRETLNEFYN